MKQESKNNVVQIPYLMGKYANDTCRGKQPIDRFLFTKPLKWCDTGWRMTNHESKDCYY